MNESIMKLPTGRSEIKRCARPLEKFPRVDMARSPSYIGILESERKFPKKIYPTSRDGRGGGRATNAEAKLTNYIMYRETLPEQLPSSNYYW